MQEEVEQRTVTLAVSTTKMTANVLKQAISKYLAYRKEKARAGPVKPCGKQSVKQLVGKIKVFPTLKSPTRTSRTLSELRGNTALTSL